MKIKTEILKNLLAKASKGAGNNGDFAITQMVKIKSTKKEGLELVTTDLRNTLKVKYPESKEDMEIVVVLDKLSKLISKTTTENVELIVKGESLRIKGNGNYTIPIETTEDGSVPKMYEPVIEEGGEEATLNTSVLRSVYKKHKAVLPKGAVIDEYPELEGVYVGKVISSTNGSLFTTSLIEMLDSPIILTPELFDLIQLIDEDEATITVSGRKIRIFTPTTEVLGNLNDLVEDYPLESVQSYNDMEFDSEVEINTSEWLSVLDRLSLFIGAQDHNEVNLHFKKGGVEFSTKNGEGKEILPVTEGEELSDFDCLILVNDLKLQLQNLPKSATLHYGDESCIKLTADKTIMILALSYSDEEEVEDEV